MLSAPLTVVVEDRAERDLARLDVTVRQQVVVALERFAQTRRGDVARMRGQAGRYRLRVRRWRVIFEVAGEDMRILRVGHRRDIYDR